MTLSSSRHQMPKALPRKSGTRIWYVEESPFYAAPIYCSTLPPVLSIQGGSGPRPFGAGVIFNGVDLDIENNNPKYWGDFTTKLRSLFATDKTRKYLISAAPQPEPIESPDQAIPDFLMNAWIDIAFIQVRKCFTPDLLLSTFFNNYFLLY